MPGYPERADRVNLFYTLALLEKRGYVLGVLYPCASAFAPGTDPHDQACTLFAGPKIQEKLNGSRIAEILERTVDYGWLWFIAQPLFWLLQTTFKAYVGNWGWSIILS